MKKFIAVISFAVSFSLLSQNTAADTAAAKKPVAENGTKTETPGTESGKTQDATAKTETEKTDTQKTDAVKTETDQKPGALPSGYADAVWGENFDTVKQKIKGKIVFSDEDRVIISKESGITYKYGFFYIDPENVKDMQNSGSPARLFYCVVEFPYISADEIKKKVSEKYGEPVGENIKNNKGAMYWNSENTSIVIWVDQYEKKAYSRKVVYFDNKIIAELKDYKYRIFNKKELDAIKNFIP